MLVAVHVSTNGSLKEVLQHAAYAIREARKRFPAGIRDIAVYGPRKGFYRGNLAMLEYRITDKADRVWERKPDISEDGDAGVVWEER